MRTRRERPHLAAGGLRHLPVDLTPSQLAAAPVLASLDDLVIDDLIDAEYAAFLAGLDE